ncbi:unnamed protein product [Adineta steineri]|uniref:NAD(P)(+)--arginine ADP-ribosyltransferase n=1 Tax=Adineta steineri TaxID=433720 RepID=A0A813WNH4_9BILA|nr:unnamed protein product [Adineta steineri]CAF3940334.1 unnamed protein product [Adineta steineri]
MSKQDLIDHFKHIYQGNSAQEGIIVEFENDYRPEKAIWWYTRPTFIYSTLNKALRESDFEVLFALRFFIADLHRQLTDEHRKTLHSHIGYKPISYVYRGQAIEVKELNFIRRNLGQFLSIQSFLSTSTDRQVALSFAMASTPPTTDTTRILFQFNIETHVFNTKPYANIKELSFFREENETLLMLGSIFRIEQVEYSETEQLWVGILSLCSEEVYELKDLMKHMKKEFGNDASSLGWILYNQAEYEKARHVFQQLLSEPSMADFDRARCYHGLGSVAKELEEYNLALQNYKNEVELWKKLNKRMNIGVTYRTIGEAYYFKNELDLAFSYQQKALDILLPLNHPKVSKVYRAMGNIYIDKHEFDLAIEQYENSLRVDLRHLPGDHPSFGITHAYIGDAQEKKGDYKRAVENLDKARAIYEKALPPNHPRILHLKENINKVKSKLNPV